MNKIRDYIERYGTDSMDVIIRQMFLREQVTLSEKDRVMLKEQSRLLMEGLRELSTQVLNAR